MLKAIWVRGVAAGAMATLWISGGISGGSALGQTFLQDYVWNRPGVFAPCDPWEKGAVFRTHTGHDGLFYNCDGEEEKRCSPYIYWPERPCDDLLSFRRIRCEWKGTIEDAKDRVRMGACVEDCYSRWRPGYPPGAGYGVDPQLRLQQLMEAGAELAPEPVLEVPSENQPPQTPAPQVPAPPAPEPAVGQRSTRGTGIARAAALPRISDLPAINHLKRTPKSR
jgi:hypothetical protein